MTRINDLSAASAQASAISSINLWGIFNGKDYRVPLGNLRALARESLGCTLQNTGADLINSGQVLLWDGMVWGASSYYNASSRTGVHIFHDKFDYVSVIAQVGGGPTAGNFPYALTINGSIQFFMSAKTYQDTNFFEHATPMVTPPFQVNSGDVIGIIKTGGNNASNTNYYDAWVWISVIPEVFK